MAKAWALYLKKPQTTVAVVVALMAQIIFCLFWMTAYDGVLDRTDRLKVAIVNEDGESGRQIGQHLQDTLPFETALLTAEEARRQLEKRDAYLIITIPEHFSAALKDPSAKAVVRYTLNEANAQMPKGVAQSVAAKVTGELNAQASLQGTQSVLQQLNMPAGQASQTAQSVLTRAEADVTSLHPVNGLNNQMVPMMLVLGSFVGAMLMGMNVHQVSLSIGSALTRRQHFLFRLLFIGVASFVISIIGSTVIAAFGGQMEQGFVSFWLFHWLTILTFMLLAQTVLMVFGMAGMLINMALLSLQLVTSGTIVPSQMLSGTYRALAHIMPATYSVEGIMNIQFGGTDTLHDVGLLLAFSGASVLIGLAATLWKGHKNIRMQTTIG
ncbi:YhgE/Pip domain-containing protein [Paenibacillus hodogayensis]|uniref:YhgE/Pip domain-containing protein n=1 Tax=Paenibacillus hodogayensis TaxID=279208 RepID=A0ABV5W5W8_9BACL